MSDERLDRLIDEVAKQLTAGQPSSDFRARVIAGLDRHPRRAWWTSWIAVPLGAIAVAMIALAVARPFKGRDRADTAVARADVRLAPSPPGGSGATGKADTSTPPLVRLKADTAYDGTRQGTRASAPSPPSSGAAAIAALAPPPLEMSPLDVEAIGVEALPIDSIAVKQLDAVAPIPIDPLPTDEMRPPGGAKDEPLDHRP